MSQKVPAYDYSRHDRRRAPHHDPRTLLDYGSDPNRLSPPPGNIPQRTRSTTVTGSSPVAPREEAHTPARVPAAASSLQPVTKNRAEYGHFNEDRLLALKAHAGSDDDSDHSTVAAPAPLQHSGTDANAQPVAPRTKQREASTAGLASSAQGVNQPSSNMSNKAVMHAGDKRKGSDATVTYVVPSKKRKKISGEIEVAPGTVFRLPSFPNMRIVMGPGSVVTENNGTALFAEMPQNKGPPKIKGPPKTKSPSEHQGFSCIGCVNEELTNCDGQAHCYNCKGKCKYVLCEFSDCSNATCVKIHRSQYDLNARKPGETRRQVVYDNITEKSLTKSEKLHLRAAIARMDALRAGGNLNSGQNTRIDMLQLDPPVPGTTSWQAHKAQLMKEKVDGKARTNTLLPGAPIPGTITGSVPGTGVSKARDVQVKKEDSDGEERFNALPTEASIFGSGQSRDTQVVKRGVAQPAQMGTLPTEASRFGAGFLQARGAQAISTETGAPAFGARFWKPPGATDPSFSRNAWQAQNGQPGSAFGRLASVHTKNSQAGDVWQRNGVDRGEPGSAFGQLASMHIKQSQVGNVWQASSAQSKAMGDVDREPGSGFGPLAPLHTDSSQTGPFPTPQAVRNALLCTDSSQPDPFPMSQAVHSTLLAARMPTTSDAIGAWVGPANRNDSVWSGDQHNKGS